MENKLLTVRITRREFLRLPMPARRRILAEQAAKLMRAVKRERERKKPIVFGSSRESLRQLYP